MRLTRSALACAAILSGTTLGASAFAAPAPTQTPAASAAPAAPANPNPLIASVDGQQIHLDDVKRAAANLPPQARQLPASTLIGLLVGQLIDQKAIQIQAYKEGLNNKPDVKSQMQEAANSALQNAYLSEKVAPQVTEDAIKQAYQTNYASKKGEQEIHARHILVASESQAQDIIKQLNHGADFAKLAKSVSTDKGSGASGGDLGWFKKGDMLPAFSDAAFKMKPNSISQTPVKTQYGYHVIQVLGTRVASVPPIEQVHDEIRQQLIRDDVRKIVTEAQSKVKVVRYDAQGKPIDPNAPPAAAPAAPASH
ncbi:peptidylprolyl isomerase [Kozakia baliensis]|uniref:peptidylprolyl isomerase n=1 Tax=Kozakia baliensis TaxID=153496 RepID=UPI00345BA20A